MDCPLKLCMLVAPAPIRIAVKKNYFKIHRRLRCCAKILPFGSLVLSPRAQGLGGNRFTFASDQSRPDSDAVACKFALGQF